MTISHERRKKRIRKYRKPLRDWKADCFIQRCRQRVVIYRHLEGKIIPLCADHDEQYHAMRREYGRRSDYDLRTFLESL